MRAEATLWEYTPRPADPKHSNNKTTDPVVFLLHGGHEGNTTHCRNDDGQQGAGPSRPKPGVHREAEDWKQRAHEAFEEDGDGKSRRPLIHKGRLVAVGGEQGLLVVSLYCEALVKEKVGSHSPCEQTPWSTCFPCHCPRVSVSAALVRQDEKQTHRKTRQKNTNDAIRSVWLSAIHP